MTSPEGGTSGMGGIGGLDVNSLVQRVRRLVMLDTTVFDEVRTDRSAMIPAILVAATSTFAAAIGGWFWWLFQDLDGYYISGGEFFVQSVVIGTILAVALWFVWVGVSYIMLQQLFRARVDVQELIRVMGFAAAPLALCILLFVPVLGFGIGLASLALLFGTNVLAIQSATDAPAGKVLVAAAAGFAVWAIIIGVFVSDQHVYAPGFFIFKVPVEYFSS